VDALGYIFLGLATLFASFLFANRGFERWVKWFFLANALVTPLIGFVYFYPTFSYGLLLLGAPWIITASGSMLVLALYFARLDRDNTASLE
jgi:multisubunit Na+/H+ antiporter MnhB subunit